MNVKDDEKFIRKVEGLIDPEEVSTLLFFQTFKRLLPKKLFKKLLYKASGKTPYIGFVIEPYSLFLFFKLKDIEKAKSLLPDRYKLIKTKIFEDDEPQYYFGLGVFNSRASTFWGARLESYLIAEDTETGLKSFIFIDILSNTIIALPPEGITDPNCQNALITISSRGELIVDFKEDKSERQIKLKGNINQGKMTKLEQSLWLTGNTSISHSTELSDGEDDPFAVIFDPAEVVQALDIPTDDMSLIKNTLFPGLAEPEIYKAVCFPFAQHYIADSPGCRTFIKNRDELIETYNHLSEEKKIQTFSTKAIKTLFFLGISISSIASIALLVLLILIT